MRSAARFALVGGLFLSPGVIVAEEPPARPSSPEAREAVLEEMFLRAVTLQEEERAEDAIGIYRLILEIDPGHVDARYNLALALESLGAYEVALDQYRECARRSPEDPEPVLCVALLLHDIFGRIEDARAMYRRAIEMGHPDRDLIEGCIAEIEEEFRRREDARPADREAPGDPGEDVEPPPEPDADMEDLLDLLLEALEEEGAAGR